MRSRVAAVGVVLALSTGALGMTVVALGLTVPPTSQPQAAPAGVRVDASGAAFPTVEDHCYVEGMIPHHEQALELSGLVLDAAGVRDRTRALAAFIVADQTAEIETMRAWQDAWRQAVPVETAAGHGSAHGGHADDSVASPESSDTGCGEHAHTQMKGMATPEQLAALGAAEGAEADRLFLELMIAHHEGALEMAESAVRGGSNAFVRTSGKHVLVEQAREITAMTALLAEAP